MRIIPASRAAALLLLGLGLFGFCFTLALWANYQSPRLTSKFEWQDPSWRVDKASAPLQPGDRLLTLCSRPPSALTLLVDSGRLTSSGQFWSWLDEKKWLYQQLRPEQVNVSVEREGKMLSLELPVLRHDWSFLRDSEAINLFVGAIYFLIGWAVYLRSKDDKLALCFYLFCLTMSLGFVTAAASLLCNPVLEPAVFRALNIFYFVNFVLSPAQMAHFALLLPRDRSQPWHLLLIYGPTALALAFFKVSLFVPLVGLNYAVALLIMLWNAQACQGMVERQQMKWVGAGFLLGTAPGLLINGLPLLLFGERLMSDTIPGSFLVFVPLCMAVAIRRYRLFDIGAFMQGTFVYVSAVFILLGFDIALLSWLGFARNVNQAYILSLAMVLALYGPLRARIASFLSEMSGGFRPGMQEALAALSARLQASKGQEVLECLRTTIHSLYAPEFLKVQASEGLPVGAHLQLGEPPTVLVVLSADQALRCGPLPNRRFYTSSDRATLGHLAHHCSLHLQTASLYEEASLERNRRLAEREKILGDLHDGVGSALAAIRLGSQEPRTNRLAADALFELQHFLYSDADYTMPFQEFVAEIRAYARNLSSGQPLEFQVEARGELETQLSRALALELFRLLKEVMSNTLKHSGANTARLLLECEHGRLRIVASDDGRGLQAGSGKGRGLSGLRRRVEEKGGTFDLSSENGLQITLEVPISV